MFDARSTAPSFESDPSNLYEVLDIKPDATPSEIREAYLRIKNTYAKDSVALYTLVDPGEREDILGRIERAYAVLSNPDKRRDYDQNFESYVNGAARETGPQRLQSQNVVSIDRFPPMEQVDNAERALLAPATDFSFQSPVKSVGRTPSFFDPAPFSRSAGPEVSQPAAATSVVMPDPVATSKTKESLIEPPMALHTPVESADIEIEIQAEAEWSGAFLRKVREARGISIEDITQATRITRTYILAIEEENMPKLPAPVYIRGFVNQIGRVLRLSGQDVAAAYMRRCQRLHPEKFR